MVPGVAQGPVGGDASGSSWNSAQVKVMGKRRVRVWQAAAILHGHCCPLQDAHQVFEGIFIHGSGDVWGRNAGLHHPACFTKPG